MTIRKLLLPTYLLCSYVLGAASVLAQRQPETAHVNMYFPLVLDGGPTSDQYQTTFRFVNLNVLPANVTLLLYAPDGSAWNVDFGSGAKNRHEITVPANGSRSLVSTVGNNAVPGWAMAFSTGAVQGVAVISEQANGYVVQQFAIQPVLPALDYVWPGDRNSLISVGNVYTDSDVSFQLGFLDGEGNIVGDPVSLTVGPQQQSVFTLGDRIPNIGDQKGAVFLSAVSRPHDVFVAASLGGTGRGVYSSLPNGGVSWPISHWDRIWLVYAQVAASAQKVGMISSRPELKIFGGQEINAYARGGKELGVTVGLSELISDSPSELAFAIAHEMGHIYQQRNGGKLEFHPNPEFDADVWGSLLSLVAGYDPYAAAGTLAKLSMASGDAGLLSQFEDQLGGDVHKSFNSRLENIFNNLVMACNSSPDIKQICATYKGIIHPHLPGIAPLRTRPVEH